MAEAAPSKYSTVYAGSILNGKSGPFDQEQFEQLVQARGGDSTQVKWITSTGQTAPSDGSEWFEYEDHEFVILVSGRAKLRIQTESEDRPLGRGDYLIIPQGVKHKVTYTSGGPKDVENPEPAIWLAVHFTGELS